MNVVKCWVVVLAMLLSVMRPSAAEEPRAALEAIARGDSLRDKRDFNAAIAAYDEAIRLDPKIAAAYSKRGYAFREKGEPDKAIADCTEAVRLDPTLSKAYVTRAVTYGDKHDLDHCIADCAEAIRLDPKCLEAYVTRAAAYGRKREFEKSIADCNEAIRLDPKCAMAYANRAAAFQRTNDLTQAIADCTEAIRLDPNFAGAHFNRGIYYRERGEFANALNDFDETIRLDPKYAKAYYWHGVIYKRKGEAAKAETDFAQAAKLGYVGEGKMSLVQGGAGPTDANPYKETIEILASGSEEKRKATIEEIQTSSEKYAPPVLYALSAALFQQGKNDDAAFWFYAAQVRARFDANRCADETARQAVAVLNEKYGPSINRYAFKNLDKLEAMIPKVVEWDRKTPHKYDHRWINLHGMGAVLSGLGASDAKGNPSPLSLPEEQWDTIAEKTRADYLKGFREALTEVKKGNRVRSQ